MFTVDPGCRRGMTPEESVTGGRGCVAVERAPSLQYKVKCGAAVGVRVSTGAEHDPWTAEVTCLLKVRLAAEWQLRGHPNLTCDMVDPVVAPIADDFAHPDEIADHILSGTKRTLFDVIVLCGLE